MSDVWADHPRIWLEPKCGDGHHAERWWCQDDVWHEYAKDGAPAGVEYVLLAAHTAAVTQARADALREAADVASDAVQAMLSADREREFQRGWLAAAETVEGHILAIIHKPERSMSDTPDTRDNVDALAKFHEAGAALYDTPEESGLAACAATTAAMLRRLLDRAEAAERDRDEAHDEACRTVTRCLAAAIATARADALREAAGAVLALPMMREMISRGRIYSTILALIDKPAPEHKP